MQGSLLAAGSKRLAQPLSLTISTRSEAEATYWVENEGEMTGKEFQVAETVKLADVARREHMRANEELTRA